MQHHLDLNAGLCTDQLVKAAAAAAAKRASASITTVFGEEVPAEATLQQAISDAGAAGCARLTTEQTVLLRV